MNMVQAMVLEDWLVPTVDLHARLDMRGIDAKLAKVGSISAMVSSMEKSIRQLVKVHHVKVRISEIKK